MKGTGIKIGLTEVALLAQQVAPTKTEQLKLGSSEGEVDSVLGQLWNLTAPPTTKTRDPGWNSQYRVHRHSFFRRS